MNRPEVGPHVVRLVHPEPWDEPEAQKRREAGYDWPPAYDDSDDDFDDEEPNGGDDHLWGSVKLWSWVAAMLFGLMVWALVSWGLVAWLR